MIREFVRLLEFEKHCKRIGLTEEDVRAIENVLLLAPAVGDVITGSGGLRKFRYALSNKGKSGGARIIYIDFTSYRKIYFVTAYSKNETDNLSPAERNELKILVKILEAELRRAKQRG
jgi:hypothetical protein